MIFNRKVIALVPIKEHSERVKSKNFRDFNGRPLYHHIMETLQKIYAIDEIIINTDSQIVSLEAPQNWNKVKIHLRPEELKGDFVSVNKLIKHDLENSDGDIYLQTHATNPLIKAETIAMAIKKFAEVEEEENDSLFTVNRFQTRFYKSDGKPINHNPQELLRTQDLDPVFEENSCIYLFTKESFAKEEKRIGVKPFMYETPHIESIDIDDEFSFKLAEILSIYHGQK